MPDAFNDDFIALIPAHRAFISQLLSQKVVESYASSAGHSRGRVAMHGEDAAVLAVVEQLPRFGFLAGVEIDKSFALDSGAFRFPLINLE